MASSNEFRVGLASPVVSLEVRSAVYEDMTTNVIAITEKEAERAGKPKNMVGKSFWIRHR